MVLKVEENLLLGCVHQGEASTKQSVLGKVHLLKVEEPRAVGRRVDLDSQLVGEGARHKHVLWSFDDCVSRSESFSWRGLPIVI